MHPGTEKSYRMGLWQVQSQTTWPIYKGSLERRGWSISHCVGSHSVLLCPLVVIQFLGLPLSDNLVPDCYDLVLLPLLFFSLTPFYITWPYITWSVTWPLSPDWMITWLSCHMTVPYCSHCLLSHRSLSTIYGDLIVSRPIVLPPIVLPHHCPCLYCLQSPIVHLIRTLSHGSCLSSI